VGAVLTPWGETFLSYEIFEIYFLLKFEIMCPLQKDVYGAVFAFRPQR